MQTPNSAPSGAKGSTPMPCPITSSAQLEYFVKGLIDAARWNPDETLSHVVAYNQFDADGTLAGIREDTARAGMDADAAITGYVEGSVLAVNRGVLSIHAFASENAETWHTAGEKAAREHYENGGVEMTAWAVAERVIDARLSIVAEDIAAYVSGWTKAEPII